jgi:peptidoglycan/LPS O-acetylase OafA/YrhL
MNAFTTETPIKLENQETKTISEKPASPAKSPSASWRVPAIDGLRAIAALMVYFYHVWEFAGRPQLEIAVSKWNVNLLAPLTSLPSRVDLFMVLSGFCLFLPLCKPGGMDKWNIKTYTKRRLRRIIPPYYFALVYASLLPVLLVIVMRAAGREANWQPFPTLWEWVTHLLFIHTLFGDTWNTINGSLWTLGLEMQFYLAFPLAVWGYSRWGLKFIGGMIVVSLLYRTVAAYILASADDTTRFLSTIFFVGRWTQFAAGMLAAWVVARYWKSHIRRDASWGLSTLCATLAIYILAVSEIVEQIGHYPIRDMLLSIAFAGAVLTLCISATRVRWFVENRVITWFGFISYSFFLVHQPTAWYLSEMLRKNAGLDGIVLLAVLSSIGLLITTCIAYLFFLICERPFLNTAPVTKKKTTLRPQTTDDNLQRPDWPEGIPAEPNAPIVQDQAVP